MSAKKLEPSQLTNEELEKRWTGFIASGKAGIEASELRTRALGRYHEIILKEREARIATGPASFSNWKRAKTEIRQKSP